MCQENGLHRADGALITDIRGSVNLETRLNQISAKIVQLAPDVLSLPGYYLIDAFPQTDMLRKCLQLISKAQGPPIPLRRSNAPNARGFRPSQLPLRSGTL